MKLTFLLLLGTYTLCNGQIKLDYYQPNAVDYIKAALNRPVYSLQEATLVQDLNKLIQLKTIREQIELNNLYRLENSYQSTVPSKRNLEVIINQNTTNDFFGDYVKMKIEQGQKEVIQTKKYLNLLDND